MIYEVRATFYFKTKTKATERYQSMVKLKEGSTSVNPTAKNAQISIVELIKNGHSTNPAEPCELIATTKPDKPAPNV